MTTLMAVAAAITLLTLLMTVRNLGRYVPPPASAGAADRVSVCVPARNEAANLRACVESALAQRDVEVEVLVYDDQSDDETPEILAGLAAEDARVRAVPTAQLPDGWNGKQWGCDRMGRAATGEWVLFTDADVRLEPTCLGRAVAEAGRRDAELVSTFPRQIIGSIGEALTVPMIHFVLLGYLPIGRMRATMDPNASAACGQFMLARRTAWIDAGGHAAFRSSMHDGVKMPRAFRRAGHRTDLFDGTDLVRCRMYHGFREAWRGFTKNAYEGLGHPALLLFLTALHLVGHVAPWLYLLGAGATGRWRPWPVALAAVAIGAAYAQRALLARRFRQPIVSVLLHPCSVVVMTAVQWWSLWLHLRGERSWKGRAAPRGEAGGTGVDGAAPDDGRSPAGHVAGGRPGAHPE